MDNGADAAGHAGADDLHGVADLNFSHDAVQARARRVVEDVGSRSDDGFAFVELPTLAGVEPIE